MLVLEVTEGQKVFINDHWITLVESKFQKARIGFDFDKSIRIERQSVRERRLKQIDEAAGECH